MRCIEVYRLDTATYQTFKHPGVAIIGTRSLCSVIAKLDEEFSAIYEMFQYSWRTGALGRSHYPNTMVFENKRFSSFFFANRPITVMNLKFAKKLENLLFSKNAVIG